MPLYWLEKVTMKTVRLAGHPVASRQANALREVLRDKACVLE